MDKMPNVIKAIARCRRTNALFIILISALLFAGCGTLEGEITFLQNERWKFSGSINVTEEMVKLSGGEEVIDNTLKETFQKYKETIPGFKIEWQKERAKGNIIYKFSCEGKGWENLEKVFLGFSGSYPSSYVSISSQNGEIHFVFSVPEIPGVYFTSLVLKGGRIISSNADEVTDGNAYWYNPKGTIEAVLTEKKRLLGIPSIIKAGLAAGAVFIILAAIGVVAFLIVVKGKPIEGVKEKAKRVAFEADKRKRIFQIQSEISSIKAQIERKTGEIGAAVLRLFDAGQLNQPELIELCKEIVALREQIVRKEMEIKEIEEEKFPEKPALAIYGHICPKCKVKLPQEVVFCPRCGTKTVDIPAPTGLACAVCGFLLPEGAIFCPKCGTKVAK